MCLLPLSSSPGSHCSWKPLIPLPPWDSHENHGLHIPACCTGRHREGDGGWDTQMVQPFHFHTNYWAGFWANWVEGWCQPCCQLTNPAGFIAELGIWESPSRAVFSPVGMRCCETSAEVLQLQRPCPVSSSVFNMDQMLRLNCKSHSAASRIQADSWNPTQATVTSLGPIARLWSTNAHLLRAQFIPNASQDGQQQDIPLENSK